MLITFKKRINVKIFINAAKLGFKKMNEYAKKIHKSFLETSSIIITIFYIFDKLNYLQLFCKIFINQYYKTMTNLVYN